MNGKLPSSILALVMVYFIFPGIGKALAQNDSNNNDARSIPMMMEQLGQEVQANLIPPLSPACSGEGEEPEKPEGQRKKTQALGPYEELEGLMNLYSVNQEVFGPKINPIWVGYIESSFDVFSVAGERIGPQMTRDFEKLHKMGHDYTNKNMDQIRIGCWKETVLYSLKHKRNIPPRFGNKLDEAMKNPALLEIINMEQTIKIQLEKIQQGQLQSGIEKGHLTLAQGVLAGWIKAALNLAMKTGHPTKKVSHEEDYALFTIEMQKASKMWSNWLLKQSPQ